MLARTTLCDARFVRSRLLRAELDHAESCPPAVAAADAAQGPPPPPPPPPNFSGADLRGAQLLSAGLRGVAFTRARVDRRTSFDGADLAGARFDLADVPAGEPFAGALTPPVRGSLRVASSAGGAARAARRPVRLGLLAGDDVYFFAEVSRGVREAAERAGVPVVVEERRVYSGSSEERVAAVIGGLGRRVDALVMSFVERVELEPVRAAFDAGVTVVCYDQCAPVAQDRRPFTASYESDHAALGADSASGLVRWLSKRRRSLPRDLRILALRACDSEGCFRRVQGFRDRLAASRMEGLPAATDSSGGGLLASAYRVAQHADAFPDACALLQDHPGPAVLWAANESGTVAAVEAVHALGLEGQVWVFGIDLDPQLAGELLDPRDVLQSVTDQSPRRMGVLAASRAIAAARGELSAFERVRPASGPGRGTA